MARIDNLENFLTDVATAIKNKKSLTDKIPAENFDTEIDSIVTGTVLETVEVEASEIVEEEDILKVVSVPITEPVVIPENGVAEVIADKTVLAESIGLTCEKIVSGESVLGIEGTAEGVAINNQDKTIVENGTYTADEGYTGLGNVTVDVPFNGIKQFYTEEEMQNDTNALEGNLAIVYRNEVQPINVNSKFSKAMFPSTVVLPNAFDNSTDTMFRSTSNSGMFDCWVTLDSSSFRMECYTQTGMINIQYQSSDGITYTRTTFEGEGVNGDAVDFGVEIYCYYTTGWVDEIGYFIHAGGMYFDGLFEYALNSRTDLVRMIAINDLPFDTSTKTLTWNGEYNGGLFNLDKIIELKRAIVDACPTTISNAKYSPCHFVISNGEPYICRLGYDANSLDSNVYGVNRHINGNGVVEGSCSYANMASTRDLWAYKLDLENMTFSELVKYTPVQSATGEYYWDFPVDTASVVLDSNYNNAYYPARVKELAVMYGKYKYTTVFNGSLHPDGYIAAQNQFTLSDPSQIVEGLVALGKDGEVVGDGSIYDNLDASIIRSKMFNLTPRENNYYGEISTKFVSDITDASKIHFTKHKQFVDKPEHIIGELTYERDTFIRPTTIYTYTSRWQYSPKYDMVISFQNKKNDDDTYEYHTVIESTITGEILADFINPSSSSYAYSTDNAVYSLFGKRDDTNGTLTHYAHVYNLSTLTRTVLYTKTYTYNSSDDYKHECKCTAGRYFISYTAHKKQNSTTATHSFYVYDDVLNTYTTLMEDEVVTMPGTSYSLFPSATYYNSDNTVYILCGLGYFGTLVKLYKLDKASFNVSMLWSNKNATDTSNDIDYGYDIDENYIIWGQYLIGKNSSTNLAQCYYNLYTTDGELFDRVYSSLAMLNINNEKYIVIGRRLYKFDNYVINGSDVDVTFTNYYNLIQPNIRVKEEDTYVTYIGDLKYSTINVTDDYYTIDFANSSDMISGTMKVFPIDDSTSLDYDYSIIYCGQDVFVMKRCDSLDNGLSANEYNKALGTTEQILG